MKKYLVFLLTVLLIAGSCPAVTRAGATTVNLSSAGVRAGDPLTVSGTVYAVDSWVAVKVLDNGGNIVFFDSVRSGVYGNYACTFNAPDVQPGELKVIAGSGSDVAAGTLTVTQSGGGDDSDSGDDDDSGGDHNSGGNIGGSSSPGAVHDTTGRAYVYPSAGGTVSLGGRAGVDIPAGALRGSSAVQVAVQEVGSPPAAPAGFMVQGLAYRFTVGGQEHYNFNKTVTLTFTFDPSALAPGEEPAVFYYDEAAGQWVNIGGTVSGNTITVTVDHFTQYAVMTEIKLVPEQEPEAAFKDISGHWAEANIKKLVALGAISGYPDGSFRPDNTITRAEFAAMLVQVFKLEARDGKVFRDTAGHWARAAIATAAALGIVNGYPDGNFGPDDLITREQMAVMTVKAAGLTGSSQELTFRDTRDISDWALKAVTTAIGSGIMNGYPDNTVRPEGNATRAEAVTVILNALDHK